MRPEQYRAAAALAGPALLRARPHPQLVHQLTGGERNAVYVACDRTGRVRYVGSTIGRPAWARVCEHLTDVHKTREWHEVWVIPLRSETPEQSVRSIEGRVGRYLRPTDTQCLPRCGPG